MWWFILIPIVWVIISKIIWSKQITLQECFVHLSSVILGTMIIFAVGYYNSTGDTLILHGQITEKIRENNSHQESYSCNCRTYYTGSGSNRTSHRRCDTCWRTIYTVDWYLKSTLGNIDIHSESSRSKSVWSTHDPDNYINAYVGEPCSKTKFFKNYVKGSPSSLFNTNNHVVESKTPLPSYPEIYGIYKADNVLNVNTRVDTELFEIGISEKLKTLGAKKQVNIIIVLVNTTDKNYRYALEKAWLGGKKNDVVVIIGTTDNKTISWVDGFTFGLSQGNHLMLAEMLDNLRGKDLESSYVIEIISSSVDKSFTRKKMEDFKYLAREIEPSTTLLWIVFVLQLLSNIGITVWSIRNNN